MDPITVGAITAAIRGLFDLVTTLKNKGALTEEEAKAIMDDADTRRKAAVAAWDALKP